MQLIDNNANVTGTSLQGYISTSFDNLVKAFGKPIYDCDDSYDKVQVEWALQFEDEDGDSVVATIYNWKDYDDGSACKQALEYDWHIGGNSYDAVQAVYAMMETAEAAEYYGA